jgi:hypothetical protein
MITFPKFSTQGVILSILLHAAACSPGAQNGLGSPVASGRDPGINVGQDQVTIPDTPSDALSARLAACELTAEETQDLELCSQVLKDSGDWLDNCQSGVKTPCSELAQD